MYFCFKFKFLFLIILLSPMSAAMPTKDNTSNNANVEIAMFAGGCFWCMEPAFDKLKGVISTISGYTDGHKKDPTYEEVSSGTTGHTEAILVAFDPNQISYESLLDVFWQNIDPIAKNRQFCDIGSQYRSGIYYYDEKQMKLAEKSKHNLSNTINIKAPIATEIKLASKFYQAEEYHQDFYKKKPLHYKYYRFSCGRDKRLKELWGK